MPAAEIHAETIAEDLPTLDESKAEDAQSQGQPDVAGDNRLTVDDGTRQALTREEIEELKKADTGSGKEIIAKIMQSHAALDQKTAFSLAKYTLRKNKKYLKRFTLLPLDVNMLTGWMLEGKEPARVMELRPELLGLMSSWSNVHYGELDDGLDTLAPSGRVLVIDDTAGLVVASLAERMGLLYPPEEAWEDPGTDKSEADHRDQEDYGPMDTTVPEQDTMTNGADQQSKRSIPEKPKRYPPDAMSATNNTITLIHPATQPNISMLSYFSYDPSDTKTRSAAIPASSHLLHTHLKTLNFLQLKQPDQDGSYQEPEVFPDETIAAWKSSQRGNYYRKRRRWERVKRVVDEAREGGFDSLVVATAMSPLTVLQHTVPLLKGGAQVVVYSPNLEPLAELADFYSSARRTAFLNMIADEDGEQPKVPSEEFPVDPRLLLAPTVQTARAREWQVLPGRTHPLMTSKGGAEGYLFTATRVLPAQGKVQARGNFTKKRKAADYLEKEGSSTKTKSAPGSPSKMHVDS